MWHAADASMWHASDAVQVTERMHASNHVTDALSQYTFIHFLVDIINILHRHSIFGLIFETIGLIFETISQWCWCGAGWQAPTLKVWQAPTRKVGKHQP